MQLNNKNQIGTFIPLFSLRTRKNNKYKNGIIDDASELIKWLKKTNQSAWQTLPLHETQLIKGSSNQHVSSPYKSYGIGLDPKYISDSKIKYSEKELELFKSENEYWLSNYALFCALRDHFSTDDWTKWDSEIRDRNSDSIEIWSLKLNTEIKKHIEIQWKLHNEFSQVRNQAKLENIKIIGDMQFYVPLFSPLVWKYQNAFKINSDGSLKNVSGIPYKTGAMYGRQIWGHPLYNWEDIESYSSIIDLFITRLKYLKDLFDIVRIDHANGFFKYGSIDPLNEENDCFHKGPGFPAFRSVIQAANDYQLTIFAEDSGIGIDDLRTSMQVLKVSGVRVLRCAYDEEHNKFLKEHLDLDSYPKNSIAYTTTHDTETLVGYLKKLNQQEKELIAKKIGIDFVNDINKLAKELRNILISSPSMLKIIPIQDWLLSDERINTPGTEKDKNDPNWKYRIEKPIEDLLDL